MLVAVGLFLQVVFTVFTCLSRLFKPVVLEHQGLTLKLFMVPGHQHASKQRRIIRNHHNEGLVTASMP
jgi:hypothetical protein